MYMVCRHIKANGLQCQSRALKGHSFCFYHSKTHTVPDDVKFGPIVLPVPEDAAAIQISVARINEAILRGYLDIKKGQLVLSALKLAARFIDPKKYFDAGSTIEDVENDDRGDELAPQKLVCEDEDACETCPYTDICPGQGDEDKAEEEAEQEDNEQNKLPLLHAAARPSPEPGCSRMYRLDKGPDAHPCDRFCRNGGKQGLLAPRP
jgi:hypothetical protein